MNEAKNYINTLMGLLNGTTTESQVRESMENLKNAKDEGQN